MREIPSLKETVSSVGAKVCIPCTNHVWLASTVTCIDQYFIPLCISLESWESYSPSAAGLSFISEDPVIL